MSKCPICQSPMEIVSVFDSVPVSSAQLFDTATNVQTTSMNVRVCDNCNHVTNFNFQPSIYTADSYVTKKAISVSMNNNLTNIINFLNVSNISILEIGSGSGEIANYYSEHGCNVTTVDPCITGYENTAITHYQQFFDVSFPDNQYDLIIARHIIEHIDNPIEFLKLCKSRLSDTGQVYIEVPNLDSTLMNDRIVDFFNDHVQHFSINSLNLCSALSGFTTAYQIDLLNKSHIGIIITPIKKQQITNAISRSKLAYDNILSALNIDFTIYGAGAHASTFVGSIPIEIRKNIVAIIDKDQRKSGKFIPGCTIPITLPKMITTSVVVNTSVLYKSEIEQFLQNELNFTGEIVHL